MAWCSAIAHRGAPREKRGTGGRRRRRGERERRKRKKSKKRREEKKEKEKEKKKKKENKKKDDDDMRNKKKYQYPIPPFFQQRKKHHIWKSTRCAVPKRQAKQHPTMQLMMVTTIPIVLIMIKIYYPCFSSPLRL